MIEPPNLSIVDENISRFAQLSIVTLARMHNIGTMAPIYKSRRTTANGARGRGRAFQGVIFGAALATIAAASVIAGSPAKAQNAYCDTLRTQIASAGNNPGAVRYRAAAAKQTNEINRTAAYAHSIGCDRRQFLFFGDPPPRQCGQINAKIYQMQANLASLERGSGEGQRQALLARYDAQCRNRRMVAARPGNFFEELFGIRPFDEGGSPQGMPIDPPEPVEEGLGRGLGGSMAICVRACDGGFFPVSYSARSSNLDDLAELCKALCPNAEVTLYTRAPSRDIETAVSIDGEPYTDHPNALRFQKTFDPSCACKAPDKSWVETLAEAERIIAERHSDDVVVTAEKAEQLSRPLAQSARSPAKKSASTPKDAPPAPGDAPAPADSNDKAKAEDGAKSASETHETTREVVGPDGVKRRMRIVAPSL